MIRCCSTSTSRIGATMLSLALTALALQSGSASVVGRLRATTPKLASGTTRDQSDSLRVVQYLSRVNCSARAILEGDLGRYAIVTHASATCASELLVVRVVRDSVVPLQAGRQIVGGGPTVMRWIPLRGLAGRALVTSFDNQTENVIGTVIFGDTGTGLSTIYADSGTACAPAEMRDLDGDGEPELISYREDPSGGDCGEPCHIAIRERFRMAPAWVRIDSWDGKRWVPAERRHRAFYARLSRTYEAMDRWLTSGPSATACRDVYWLTDRTFIRRWAQRSRSLANRS